ncbi:TetR/AcrR family transcriptional regulator [Viridibacterium curvum]
MVSPLPPAAGEGGAKRRERDAQSQVSRAPRPARANPLPQPLSPAGERRPRSQVALSPNPSPRLGRGEQTAVAPVVKPGRIRQAQEQTILQAAEKLFARTGFAGTSMNELALAAGLPKSTLHYYFGTKETLYRAVLASILEDWLVGAEALRADADPAEALRTYIRYKMRMTAGRPDASRVFASEMLAGAPHIRDLLAGELRRLVAAKSRVIREWIAAGKLAPVDPPHLFFTLWAMTQTYADFEPQVAAVLDTATPLSSRHQSRATAHVESFVLRACGLKA